MSKTETAETAPLPAITVNGERRPVPAGLTVQGLLDDLGIAGGKVAVERNRAIVARSAYASTNLEAGDVIEIVRFVGGG